MKLKIRSIIEKDGERIRHSDKAGSFIVVSVAAYRDENNNIVNGGIKCIFGDEELLNTIEVGETMVE